MQNLIINIPVKKLNNNILLFNILGFVVVDAANNILSNGSILIQFTTTAFFEKGIFINSDNLNGQISEIESKGLIFNCKDIIDSNLVEAALFDPNRVFVAFKKTDDLVIESIKPNNIIGNYDGLGIETIDINKSIKFWSKIGFTHIPENDRKDFYAEMIMEGTKLLFFKKGFIKHLFYSPALVFRSDDIDSVVTDLESKGIAFRHKEMYDMSITNAVIELDSGSHIFILKR